MHRSHPLAHSLTLANFRAQTGGCGQAFNAIIVSPQFASKQLLARHRLVNSVLKAEIAAIHAWTPKCYTPEQWEKKQEKEQEKEKER
jgi:stress-induced morphogen